jgi:tetratricopeptide (TPR) repeat protein
MARPDPEIAALVPLAQAVLGARRTSPADDGGAPLEADPAARARFQKSGHSALELAKGLEGKLARLGKLEQWFRKEGLIEQILQLPFALSSLGEIELALDVAAAFAFIAPDALSGDSAVILARAGRREAAIQRVERNLESAQNASMAEAKAGDAYRALGEWDAAEAYYRRALAEAKTPMERGEALLRISSLLLDTGREADAAAFLKAEREKTTR